MIRVTTGSRLHFGLFALPSRAGDSRGPAGTTRRTFGGVGLMIDRPGIELTATPASTWSASGPLSERALRFARSCTSECFRLELVHCAPEHTGLGTGTQLALAVGLALDQEAEAADLAQRLGRGQRSALGVHGFFHGGFLVDGGKGSTTTLAPLVARARFPESWRIVVVVPTNAQGVHGKPESEAFAQLAQQSSETEGDALCRLTLLGMLPALHDADLPGFGEALYEFNRRVGEMFRPVQGGIYAHAQTQELVDYLRKEGIHGVGQSSWGPTTFAVTREDRAEHLAARLRERFGLEADEVIVTTARNDGAKKDPRA